MIYEKFQFDWSNNVGEKCGKRPISHIQSSKRDITPSKADEKLRQSISICSTLKQISTQYVQE